MKKKFGRLSKADQEAVESEYHLMKPEEFDESMAEAEFHTPSSVRLPLEMVESLKIVAKSKGEPEYQTLVKRWIEERLQQESHPDAA